MAYYFFSFIKTSRRNIDAITNSGKNLLCANRCKQKLFNTAKRAFENKDTKISFSAIVKNWFNSQKAKLQCTMMNLVVSGLLEKAIPSFTNYISKDFNKIKSQLLASDLNEGIIKKISGCSSAEELAKAIKSIKIEYTEKIMNKKNEILSNSTMSKVDKQKFLKVIDEEYFSEMLKLEKALSLKSTNLKVVEIEKILREKFGMEFISLKDDFEHAEKLLEACKLMTKKGETLPKNYIISYMLPGTGQCLRNKSTVLFAQSNLNRILNPVSVKTPTLFSTQDKLHSIIHEFGHNVQPKNIDTIDLPKHFISVAKSVSGYAGKGSHAELWAELYAKVQLTPQNVTKEQWELFEYLKNFLSR